MGHKTVSLTERVQRSGDESAPEEGSHPAPRGPAWLRPRPFKQRFNRPLTRNRLASLIAVVVALSVVLGVVIWKVTRDGPPPITRAEIAATVQQSIAKAQQDQANAPPEATAVYRTILPSLVTVTTKDGSLGTGVIVKSDGTLLTALHVVEDGSAVSVQFTGGTTVPAHILARQPDDDIAVIQPSGLPEVVVPAVLGGGAEIGNEVFAAGNPLGLQDSLTAGVISGLGRSTAVDGHRDLHGLIQFDAAVNPGNSGGPLLDRNAQVIGIVTGLANPAKQPFFIGIGFAVPIETAGGGAGAPRK